MWYNIKQIFAKLFENPMLSIFGELCDKCGGYLNIPESHDEDCPNAN